MKRGSLIATALGLTFTLAYTSHSSAADDGAALFKAKCSQCHGASGEGKSTMKNTSIKGTSMTAGEIQAMLTQGVSGKKGPHAKAISGLTPDQAKSLADYIKTFQ
jgi:mono/diheme cytochrome c family protein